MNGGLEFRDLTGAILRRWAVVLAVTVTAMAVAWIVVARVDEQYEATATVLAAQQPPDSSLSKAERGTSEQFALTFADVGRGPSVLEPAATELRMNGGWRALRSQTAIRLVPRTLLLEVNARAASPVRAEQIANAVSRHLVRVTNGLTPFRQEQIQRAVANPNHILPNKGMIVLTAGAIGFLVASAGAIAFELVRSRRRQAPANDGSPPHLGTLDFSGRQVKRSATVDPEEFSPVMDSAANVLLNLQVLSGGRKLRDIAVIGSPDLPSRRYVAGHLAVALSHVANTALVDLDVRRPSERRFGDGEPGVANFLASREPTERLPLIASRLPGLALLAAGSGVFHPALVFSSEALQRLVNALRKATEVTVFDLPVDDQLTEVALLSKTVDAVIVVVRARRFRATDHDLVNRLSQAGVDIAGLVTVRLGRQPRPHANASVVDAVIEDLDVLTPRTAANQIRRLERIEAL